MIGYQEPPSPPAEAPPPDFAGQGPARGILIGVLLSCPFWIGLAYTLWRVL